MRYCGTDGVRSVITENPDVIRQIARTHAKYNDPGNKWFWTVETTDPPEFLDLLDRSQRDRLSSEPAKST
jgi:hypothetical protein